MSFQPILSNNTTETGPVLNSNLSQFESVFWFSPLECTTIGIGFYSAALVGSFLNTSVLVVLCHVLFRDIRKSGSDFLIAVLTSLDLCATTVVFVLEGAHFMSPACNDGPSEFMFVVTFFLETSSALSLLNIALFRYSKICLVNVLNIDFRQTCNMTLANVAASIVATILAVLCNNPKWSRLSMLIYLSTIFIVFILMGILYLTAYLSLRKRSNQARLRNARRVNFAKLSNVTTATIPVDDINGNGGGHLVEHKVPEDENEKLQMSSNKLKVSVEMQQGGSKEPGGSRGSQISTKENSPAKTAIELMTERSAKVFIVITLLYVFCFMPNATLTFTLLQMGPKKFFRMSLPVVAQVCNLNVLVEKKIGKQNRGGSRIFSRGGGVDFQKCFQNFDELFFLVDQIDFLISISPKALFCPYFG